jgi:hypothetical protein
MMLNGEDVADAIQRRDNGLVAKERLFRGFSSHHIVNGLEDGVWAVDGQRVAGSVDENEFALREQRRRAALTRLQSAGGGR